MSLFGIAKDYRKEYELFNFICPGMIGGFPIKMSVC